MSSAKVNKEGLIAIQVSLVHNMEPTLTVPTEKKSRFPQIYIEHPKFIIDV